MASSLGGADKAVFARFAAQWVDGQGNPRTPIDWPNVNFTPPRAPAVAYWVEPRILWGTAEAVSQGLAGSRRNTAVGVVHVNVYGPRGEAGGVLKGHADAVRDVFNRAEFSGVRCGVPSGPTPVPNDSWAQVAVTVPFTVDEVL